MSMTFEELIKEYQRIHESLNAKYPVADPEKQAFARLVKIMEEQGELSELVLAKAQLQRTSKNFENLDQAMADEWADVLGTLLLLGLDLEIDMEAALRSKLKHIHERFETLEVA